MNICYENKHINCNHSRQDMYKVLRRYTTTIKAEESLSNVHLTRLGKAPKEKRFLAKSDNKSPKCTYGGGGVGGRCGEECTYIRQEDNKVFCMCEPGPVPFVKRVGCPFQPQCSAANPCLEGQGDCDYDIDCAGNLVCGDGNCGGRYHRTDDCCRKP